MKKTVCIWVVMLKRKTVVVKIKINNKNNKKNKKHKNKRIMTKMKMKKILMHRLRKAEKMLLRKKQKH